MKKGHDDADSDDRGGGGFGGAPSGYFRGLLTESPEERRREYVPPGNCFACRVSGAIGCGGVSAYLLHEMRSARGPGHRFTLAVMAAGFAGLGVYRWNLD